jgi:hypothetical protein
MSLDMNTACEACGTGLAAEAEVYICSYECTFCRGCADDMARTCPNCGGELARRPRREPSPA